MCNVCFIVAYMSWNVVSDTNYIPLQIADIARAHGIGIEEAGHVKAAFEIAFADPRQRERIFEMMDELDRQASDKGEPDGLKVCFGVDLDKEGYTVVRRADKPQPGESVLAAGKAEVYCRIGGKFPTADWLGPLVLKRPENNVKRTAEDAAGSGVRMVHSVEEAIEVLEKGGYWPIFFGGLRRYLAPKLKESRGSALLRRTVAAICTEVLSVLFGPDRLPANTSSGASPPSTVGDYGHSGPKAVLCR